jgi:hypothetical protein
MAIQSLKQEEIQAVSGGIIFGLPILGNILNPQPPAGQMASLTDIIGGLTTNGPAALSGLLSAILAILAL